MLLLEHDTVYYHDLVVNNYRHLLSVEKKDNLV